MKGKKMTKQYKMLFDGNTVKDKFDEDIILNKEPKKITNERFEILLRLGLDGDDERPPRLHRAKFKP